MPDHAGSPVDAESAPAFAAFVIPAQAGIQGNSRGEGNPWTPAFAGATRIWDDEDKKD